MSELVEQADDAFVSGEYVRAARLYSRMIEREGPRAELYYNWSCCLSSLGKRKEAISLLLTAIRNTGGDGNCYNALASDLESAGQFEWALRLYRKAVEFQPENPDFRGNLGMALLRVGEYTEGWSYYRWRNGIVPRVDDRALLSGIEKGHRLILIGEQGIGDCIQFARFVKDLDGSTGQVIIFVPKALVSLLSTAFPNSSVSVLAIEDVDCFRFESRDVVLSLMDLPYALGILDPKTIPELQFPLEKNPRLAVVNKIENPRGPLTVGFAWRGNPDHPRDSVRSIDLRQLLRGAFPDGITYHAFQLDPTEAERAALKEGGVSDRSREVMNLKGTAMEMLKVDIFVCVDTALAHLAATLSLPTIVLLPVASDWRWGVSSIRSDWYSSVRLVRQSDPGEWSSALSIVNFMLCSGDMP